MGEGGGSRLHWYMTTQFDRRFSRELVDTHYSRRILWPRSIGKRQFAIANALVLVTQDYSAGWITKWQNPVARNDGKDAWINQLFNYKNLIPGVRASELIAEAVAITRWYWQDQIPKDGFITYIAERCITSEIPGYCYMRSTPRWKRQTGLTKAKKLLTLSLTAQQLKKVEPLETTRLVTLGREQQLLMAI